jgi:hypothetical protein
MRVSCTHPRSLGCRIGEEFVIPEHEKTQFQYLQSVKGLVLDMRTLLRAQNTNCVVLLITTETQ